MRLIQLAAIATISLPLPAFAQDVPTEIEQCVMTTIAEITSRLEGVPEGGDAVVYGNDVYGVSYDEVPELRRSKVGDPIELCLSALPEDCPPGDERGKLYAAHNLRTDEGWELPDAEHMCGGA